MKKIWALIGALALCLSAAQADELDDLFSDSNAAVVEEAKVVSEPEKAVLETASFSWAGDFTGSLKLTEGYEKLQPSNDEIRNPDDSFNFDVGTRLWFDARPDRNFRVFGKFTADYPFKTAKIFELFSDFNWKEKLFFRFGKQTAGWGLSRFYQIGDPLSVGVKDPSNPSADLEGPLALRVSLPVGMNNFYVYGVLKDSYLPAELADARLTDAGAGIKGDFFVAIPKNKVIGNADLSVGAYYQRSLAPKGVVSLSTGIGKVQVFTDQVVSWGLDSYRLTDTALPSPPPLPSASVPPPVVYETEKTTRGFFYSATVGSMYVNNDWHFTGYAEYLFNASASNDDEYVDKYLTRYYAETAKAPGTTQTLTQGDAFGYLSRHNSAVSLSWSELFGNDKLSASILWMQNWVDRSGMVTPTFTVKPFDHFSVETGVNVAWGKDNTEWILKNTNPSSLLPRRLSGFIGVKIGGGKF
jgi:hypothetical protein